jgi:hypothetical protein
VSVHNDCGVDCPNRPKDAEKNKEGKWTQHWYCPLPLPEKTCDSARLAKAACDYANKVQKCYNKDKVTDTEKKWLDDRERRVKACQRELPGTIRGTRNYTLDYCEAVYREHLKPCDDCLFGNCGEGSEVNFCQAYFSGCAKKQYICQTITHVVRMPDGREIPDGHAFAIIEMPTGEKCVMDRWLLEPNAGDPSFLPPSWKDGGADAKLCRGSFFCDKNLRLESGTLWWGEGDKSKCAEKDWYKKVTCKNPDTGDKLADVVKK